VSRPDHAEIGLRQSFGDGRPGGQPIDVFELVDGGVDQYSHDPVEASGPVVKRIHVFYIGLELDDAPMVDRRVGSEKLRQLVGGDRF
jgi:hypothetical protein